MALAKLFSVLPRRNQTSDDDDAAMEGYMLALQGVTFPALVETVAAVVRGEVEGMSRKFCPTAPELSAAIRAKMRDTRRLVDSQTIGSSTFQPTPFIGIEARIAATRDRMAREGRQFICHADTLDVANRLAREKVVPAGSLWVALLGGFYGPPAAPAARTSDLPENPVGSSPD